MPVAARKILLVVNVEWYFWSHRLPLARALKARGFEVVVATAVERNRRDAIEQAGFRFVQLSLQRGSTTVWRECRSAAELYRLYRRERPALVHHITIKPVLYGSVAARLAGVPAIVNTIPGLGYMFLGSGVGGFVREAIAGAAYRVALSGRGTRVIFQNPDDRALFVSRRLVDPARARLVLGSGVDVERFSPAPEPGGVPVVVLASRLLWDKGIGELAEASRLLRARNVTCRIALAGVPDDENPNAVPESTLRAWDREGIVEWWGLRSDMPDVFRAAAIVALPTYYREGIPLVLLEAAATGRPIITTDSPGCREVVRDGVNGLLVPPRDAPALAHAIETLLSDRERRLEMGRKSRELAVSRFAQEYVIAETLAVYDELLGDAGA